MSIFPPTPANIIRFAADLRAGRVVAFATETVYGLGADATNSDAVLGIYETKRRPRFNPLIVHVPDLAMARTLVEFSPLAERLARFWPGPLTLVLKRRSESNLSDLVTAGLDTVGIRIPAHDLARRLIEAAGVPVAAPSANPSGRLSPTTAAQVDAAFEGRLPVLDGGPSSMGVESTILAVDGGTVTQLRAGALPRDEIEAAIGRPIAIAKTGATIAAPGMLASHYAPNATPAAGRGRAAQGGGVSRASAIAMARSICRPPPTFAKPPATSSPCCTSSTLRRPVSPSPPSHITDWGRRSTIG